MKKTITIITFLFLFNLPSQAETFYVSPAGNDDSSGTSIPAAWQTITKVNNQNLIPGDTVLFEAGQTFTSTIYFAAPDSGTALSPVVFSSYGTDRAIIDGGNGTAFYAYNRGGIEIKNLNFVGSGVGTNTDNGVFCYTDKTDGAKFEHIYFDSLDIHGFGKVGLVVGSWHNSYPGYTDIRITNIISYSNGQEGIFTYDIAGKDSSIYAHKKLHISNCIVHNNVRSGIIVCGVDTGIIEYCRATRNCINYSGGVGIWAYNAKNVVFRYCIAESTMSTGVDGGGFDLDGGCENCIIQYCYSHANYGPGLMHCDYPSCRPTRNNIIRYCISENDGRSLTRDSENYLVTSWGDGLENCHIFNCTAYSNSKSSYRVFGLRAHILFGYGGSPHISGCSFRNNIVYMDGVNLRLAVIDDQNNPGQPQMDTSNIKFQGNCYYAADTSSQKWVYYNYTSPHTTIESWRTTFQEMLDGNPVGFYTNPELVSPGSGGSIKDPVQMDTLPDAYNLELTSPMRDTGLDLQDLFSIDMGDYDFYNNPIPFNTKYDVGAYELTSFAVKERTFLKTHTLSFINPAGEKTIISYGVPYDAHIKLCIYNLSGRLIKTLANNHLTAGSYKTVFDAASLAGGIYFITLSTDNRITTQKLILIK